MQGILAPIQFLIFIISVVLIVRFLATGKGLWAADVSVIIKTLTLYAIMITGAIWEKVVFGQYLFARAFFWEDVFSMAVLSLHTTYLFASFSGLISGNALMILALAAYVTYIINAGQFLWKLRMARLEAPQTFPNAGVTG